MSEINLYDCMQGKRNNSQTPSLFFTLPGLTLFTRPDCEQCEQLERYLKKKQIDYTKIDTGNPEGKIKLLETHARYKENGSGIQRDEKGEFIFPILIFENKLQGKDFFK